VTERLSSGQPRLDRILQGGLPANAINLIIGAPGSGKTILTEQYIFRNATAERPGLYISTVSEPFDKIVRYGQSLEFFDAAAIGTRVLYEDLGTALHDEGLPGVLTRIDGLIKQHHPGLVAIDSFKALHAFAADEREFRRFLHDLAGRLTAMAASSFWVGEYDASDSTDAPEFAVADAIIALSIRRMSERQTRILQILKLRGSGFAAGEHSYRISAAGLDVFPRLADTLDSSDYAMGSKRQSTGVDALDALLGDGYWPGSTTLICGPSGVGKTLIGLHFIFQGARRAQPGVIATLQENRTQLSRIVEGYGWSLDDKGVHLMARSPVDVDIDEWVYELLDLIEKTGAKRVLIDSLADLFFTIGDPVRFREWMYSLTQRLGRIDVSLFMTLEVPELFEVVRISEHGMSHLADNVLLLQYVRSHSRIARAMTVLKTRASRHDPEVRAYEITEQGIVLGGSLAALTSGEAAGLS
jgi:circadian clock protein KaiC